MKNAIWEKLTGEHIAEAIVERIAEMFEDFAPVRKGYLDAMEQLSKTQGALCREEMDAIDSQLRSLVLFSGALGLKANWDCFINPVGDFLEADFEVFLREETAHTLPAYAHGQQARDGFFARLSAEEQEIYDAVREYTCYLETVAPKLAHYYGYILGNTLLPQIVPGYHPNTLQTARYEAVLARHLGKP